MMGFSVKRFAFTLLEMLLVIAIMAIMASLGLVMYRRHAETNRIDKVSLEMQQVLAAALAYNVNAVAWPADHATCNDATVTPAQTSFVDQYLPNGIFKSSLGSHFCWAGDTNNVPAGGKVVRFWVALLLPAGEAGLHMANLLAAKLPNGITTTDPTQNPPGSGPAAAAACTGNEPCYVRAEVLIPGTATVSETETHIQGVGDCKHKQTGLAGSALGIYCDDTNSNPSPGNLDGQYSVHFTCPAAATPEIIAFPNFVETPIFSGMSSRLVLSAFSITVGSCSKVVSGDVANVTCPFTAKASTKTGDSIYYMPDGASYASGGDPSIGASYVAYCKEGT